MAAPGEQAWQWHAVQALVLLLTAGLFPVVEAPWWGYPLLAAAWLWYLVLGAPAVRTGPVSTPGGLVYLLGAIPLQAALVLASPIALVLLPDLFAQVFWLVRQLWLANLAVAVTTVLSGFAVVEHFGWSQLSILGALLGVAGCLPATIGLGVLSRRLIEAAEARERLNRELRQVRSELRTAYHREGERAERERLAHDIHDTLAQGFTSLVMLIQTADALVTADPDRARDQLRLAERTARQNLAEARALVTDLMPAALRDSTLSEVICRLVRQLAEELGVPHEVTVHGGPPDLPPATEAVLVRTAQEALANIAKHAAPGRVTARLTFTADGSTLEIIDDGRGFDPAEATGFGLPGMRARLERIGGSVHIHSDHGQGTTVRITAP
ncbi:MULTISPECIES: sensor histidine kinase [unclassified Crossiella]|uniref:sensor histidine kinase n=1 Tax=unclassified Crossiella TaxID=2620835 RepID=UPI0020000956|nr:MULTISPECIES: sensor histidine kinase [unclassified Crossiella]MCK2243124.1 sensor histidine kinase [Crossiella sp. S99.2]MCK2257001.1 sensor histidine kinase [Crossiella sp. S99.1]